MGPGAGPLGPGALDAEVRSRRGAATGMKDEQQLARMFTVRKERFIERDQRNRDLQYVMLGQWDKAYPEHFRNPADRPMTHNALSTAAYDLSEMLAALP